MKTVKKLILLLIVLLAALSASPSVHSQDPPQQNTHPLLEMLALVPDNDMTRRTENAFFLDFSIHYGNYRAAEAAFPVVSGEVIAPQDAEAFQTLSDAERAHWHQAVNRLFLPSELRLMMRSTCLDHMPDALGFGYFDVDRVLFSGRPPFTLEIFGGIFDPEAIEASHLERGYAENDVEGLTVWRRADGEPDGARSAIPPGDVEVKRDPVTLQRTGDELYRCTPFGGKLYRLQPLAVIPDERAGQAAYVASSTRWELVTTLVEASQGEAPSLAEADDYGTLAEAIIAPEGDLVQAHFVTMNDPQAEPPNFFENLISVMRAEGLDKEDVTAIMSQMAAREYCGYGELPPFKMAVLADRQESNEIVNMLAVYYADEAEAQIAAEELTHRLEAFSMYLDFRRAEPLLEWAMEGTEVQMETPYVYASETTGRFAAVASVRYPLPPLDSDLMPGRLFALWIRAILSQSFAPLMRIGAEDLPSAVLETCP
jgi:hypothetical protein